MAEDAGKKLGQILLEKGYLSPDKMDEALAIQTKSTDARMLGQILVSRGYVKRQHIDLALSKQGKK